jgi:hypothetical protein
VSQSSEFCCHNPLCCFSTCVYCRYFIIDTPSCVRACVCMYLFIYLFIYCIQKFPDWPHGARTANGTAVCHNVKLYCYFVSQSSEFYRYNLLYCFSTSVCCRCLFRYRLSPETFGYTLVCVCLCVCVCVCVVSSTALSPVTKKFSLHRAVRTAKPVKELLANSGRQRCSVIINNLYLMFLFPIHNVDKVGLFL